MGEFLFLFFKNTTRTSYTNTLDTKVYVSVIKIGAVLFRIFYISKIGYVTRLGPDSVLGKSHQILDYILGSRKFN
jgi:hypothetical protein